MIAWQGAMTRVKQFRSIEKFRQLCILQTDKIIVRSHNFQKKDVVTKPKHFFKIKRYFQFVKGQNRFAILIQLILVMLKLFKRSCWLYLAVFVYLLVILLSCAKILAYKSWLH